jgi:hypothetical protein
MPADPDTPRGRRVLSKDRMEGFSDDVRIRHHAVVADLALHPPGPPQQQALDAWL